jgi:hypothetical protein
MFLELPILHPTWTKTIVMVVMMVTTATMLNQPMTPIADKTKSPRILVRKPNAVFIPRHLRSFLPKKVPPDSPPLFLPPPPPVL